MEASHARLRLIRCILWYLSCYCRAIQHALVCSHVRPSSFIVELPMPLSRFTLLQAWSIAYATASHYERAPCPNAWQSLLQLSAAPSSGSPTSFSSRKPPPALVLIPRHNLDDTQAFGQYLNARLTFQVWWHARSMLALNLDISVANVPCTAYIWLNPRMQSYGA